MNKVWMLAGLLLLPAIAACGDLMCEQSDFVGCPEECTPRIKVFSSEDVEGIGNMQQCGKGFGGIYYSFSTNCSNKIEVTYPGNFEVNEWTGTRHINGQMQSRLCATKCSENLTSAINSPVAELGLWSDGVRKTSLTLEYQCQSIPTVRLEQETSTSLRINAGIYDTDNNLKTVNLVLVYPDYLRSSQTMYCLNKTCYSDYAVGTNGTYEVLIETIDSFGPVHKYKSDSSCHLFRETEKGELISSMKYRFRFNITINPCFKVDCSDKCEGDYRYHGGFCVNGTCEYQKELCGDACNDEKSYEDYSCSQGMCMYMGKANCTSDKYCSNKTCMPKKERMNNCTMEYECASNYCTNNYCCEEGKSCCANNTNCNPINYCNPFSNHCEPRIGRGNYCDYDSQCIENNCYHNACCEDGQVCCIQNSQCQFLQECAGNACTNSIWYYLLLLTGLTAFTAGIAQATLIITQKHRKIRPPKGIPKLEIPKELRDVLK